MTTIYKLKADFNHFHAIRSVPQSAMRAANALAGTTAAAKWEAFQVELLLDDLSKGLDIGDFPSFGTIPVFSERARVALMDLLVASGELLPLRSTLGEFFVLNVTRVVDGLDEAHSRVRRFSDGKIMMIESYSFVADRVTSVPLFKIPQLVRSAVFVGPEFVARAQAAGLKGFDFEEVWSAP